MLRATPLLPLALAGCTASWDTTGERQEAARTPVTGPTWHQDVAPIVVEHCAGCHTSGGIGPMALDTYREAAPMAEAAAATVEVGLMPPFDAYETEDCAPPHAWIDDPRLDETEKRTLRAWSDAGAPEGDPATAAPLPSVTGPELDRIDRELVAGSAFSASGTTDQFMCTSMDVSLTADAWVTGVQVLPGNHLVNHHVAVYSDPYAETAGWGDSYVDCFSFPAITGLQTLAVWTPGADPVEMPEASGIHVPAGSRVILQMHYHPTGGVADPDQTTLRLRLESAAPAHTAVITSIGNFASADQGLLPGPNDTAGVEFLVPADVADHTETMAYTFGETTPFRIFSVMPHMHYIGTDMEVRWEDAEEPAGTNDECLVQAAWNFNWQRTYAYDAPIEELPTGNTGDSFWMQCRYDNTLGNPFVARALSDAGLTEPVPVPLGSGTLDEMCALILGILY